VDVQRDVARPHLLRP